MVWSEIVTLSTIFIMLLVPGWAILAVTGAWRRFDATERWVLAAGLGIAFYPVLYYLLRTILPSLRVGQNKLIFLLAGLFLFTAWMLRKNWKEQFRFEKLAGPFFFILSVTLLTRLHLARQYPFPAWTDSLHHILLTDLVGTTGKLPFDLQPYASTALNQYHLGLYALTGSLQALVKIPAHQALIWMTQVLNGLCGLGVFVFLSKRVSPSAGLAGMTVVGLFSFQPNLYFSWGRFTQGSAQSILLIAALAAWEAIRAWREDEKANWRSTLALTGIAAILIAGVFLVHFRAAGFLFPLLAIISLYELSLALKSRKHGWRTVLGIVAVVVLCLILILPALLPALDFYVGRRTAANHSTEGALATRMEENDYFGNYNANTFYEIGAKKWLVAVSVLGAIVGLFRKNRTLVIITSLWVLLLIGIGLLYRLNIPLLAFTNMTGMMIMLYLPIGLLVGIFAADAEDLVSLRQHQTLADAVRWVALILVVAGAIHRVGDVEDFRQFLTASDVKAMKWIEENTSADALFAVHTHYWLPDSPHGSDAGYYLPYYANRRTTVSTMIASLGPNYETVISESKAVMTLYSAEPNIQALCAVGIDYIYDGAKNPFDGSAFNTQAIEQSEDAQLIYQSEGVSVYQICQ